MSVIIGKSCKLLRPFFFIRQYEDITLLRQATECNTPVPVAELTNDSILMKYYNTGKRYLTVISPRYHRQQ